MVKRRRLRKSDFVIKVTKQGNYVYIPPNSDYKDKVISYLSRNLDKKITINHKKKIFKLSYGHLHSTIHELGWHPIELI